MRIFSDKDIRDLNIDNTLIIDWVKQAFLDKYNCSLPHKISQKFNEGNNFYNTMPAINPLLDTYGVKVVSRYSDRHPSIKGEILLYSYSSGELLGLLDATWITAVRTGAVAALAVDTFAKSNFENIALIGFGQTGYAFVDMILTFPQYKEKTFKLMAYKGREIEMMNYLNSLGVENVEICENNREFIENSDVIVSAVTVATEVFGKDEWYSEGVLIVPIHTRGFQNCDLFFDRVYADDISHISDFGNFNKFKFLDEFSNVLNDSIIARKSQNERIISYNIGIALHDIMLGRNIYNMLINEHIN